jgi:hypothetical protein
MHLHPITLSPICEKQHVIMCCGNKQMFKEALAVLCFMLFLGAVGFGLAWHKGHTIWQLTIEEEY